MLIDDGELAASGEPEICYHTGTLVRSVPVSPEGEPFHRAVCSSCGSWSVNLYGPSSPGPTLLREQDE